MISTDIKILEEGSSVNVRMKEYGNLFKELHIILFSNRKSIPFLKISPNVFVYPTRSIIKVLCPFDATCKTFSLLRSLGDVSDFVITTQDPFETGIVGYFVSRKFRIPFNVQIHTDFLSPYFSKQSTLNYFRVFIARHVITHAHSIRAVSNRIKNSLLSDSRFKIQGIPISVLPIFVDEEKIKKIPITIDLHKEFPQFRYIVLMASRLTKEKSINSAILAFKKVLEKKSDAGLVVVGSGPELENLKSQVIVHGLQDSVVFKPWVSQDELYSYYKTADIFLLTSLYEGYGMTLVEASLSGTKTVSVNVGVANEVGAIITDGTSLDLSDKIMKALSDSTLKPVSLKLLSKEEYLSKYQESLLL
jgi:glycosyltransferase involved in cell wall biosynthesis